VSPLAHPPKDVEKEDDSNSIKGENNDGNVGDSDGGCGAKSPAGAREKESWDYNGNDEVKDEEDHLKRERLDR